jgi:Holliday junction DNA helicase RuvA
VDCQWTKFASSVDRCRHAHRSASIFTSRNDNLISAISGKLSHVDETSVTIQAGPFDYEVLVGDFTRRQLQQKLNEELRLHTLHYIEGSTAGGRLTPRLIGFLTLPERQFFDLFCSVDGVGAKKALRAMVRPVRELAILIEEQDSKALSALPGIGPATSERIIAKLRRKMPRFALMVAGDDLTGGAPEASPVIEETYEALVMLGHSEADARHLIDEAIGTGKKFKDTESLLTAIYQKSK